MERVTQDGQALASGKREERRRVARAVKEFVDELNRIDKVTVRSNVSTFTPRLRMRPPLASMGWLLVACAVRYANKHDLVLAEEFEKNPGLSSKHAARYVGMNMKSKSVRKNTDEKGCGSEMDIDEEHAFRPAKYMQNSASSS